MRRRQFITLLGGAAVWPLAARAQQPALPVVGFLNSGLRSGYGITARAFNQGLRDGNYIDGQNIAIEYRWAEGQFDRLPTLASDLVRRRVALIVANTAAVLPAKKATTTIPIVFITSGDPVKLGLVASLSRPGGNLTGVTSLNVEVGSKRLELLHELIPAATNVAFLVHPTGPNTEILLRDVQTAARKLSMQVHVLYANSEGDFDSVFAKLAELRASALVIGTDALFNSRVERLAALTVRHAIPTIYQTREFAMAGGLISYGSDLGELFRLAGIYASRILKGEKASNLPVQEATKLELIINLKTAKAFGINVPNTLIGRADEVIE